MKKTLIIAVALLLLFPAVASAHQVEGNGFLSGLSHPVLGFDHLLAMLSVGIVSAQMGGKAIWAIPLAFVSVMLLGGIMGMAEIPLFSVELGIAASVALLGLAIAVDKKLPPLFAMVFVGFFALFHGHAHGTEIPHLARPLFYALGFVMGTACIHLGGVFVGLIAQSFNQRLNLLRYVGIIITAIGVQFIIM
jgi:urease accessory protein